MPPARRKTVFISYAHKDRKWADELLTFMAPWIRDQRCALWDDSQIKPGAKWRAEIEKTLDEATVAVLLVTKSFIASDFIAKHELPPLAARAEKGQLRLLWIAVEHSSIQATVLSQFQAVNDPSRPLEALSKPQRNAEMVRIAETIADAATMGTLAGSFGIMDETSEPMQAEVEKRPERANRKFGVQASYEPKKEKISFSGSKQSITADDIGKLPDEDREFIADLEDTMKANYARWQRFPAQDAQVRARGSLRPVSLHLPAAVEVLREIQVTTRPRSGSSTISQRRLAIRSVTRCSAAAN
jgi:hypothetical protein